jgi:hypothetical protein
LGSFLGRTGPVAVAGATLVTAALFNPLRNRIRRWVDRRFNRSRYDADLVVEQLAWTLRDRLDSEEIVDEWVDAVSGTVEPAMVGAWIKRPARSRPRT